jgi:hypothetical protein
MNHSQNATIISFHLSEISIAGKSIEKENRTVFSRD